MSVPRMCEPQGLSCGSPAAFIAVPPSQAPELLSTLQTLLPLVKSKVTKCIGELEYAPRLPVTVYSQYDFDNDDEYGHCMNLIRSKAHQVVCERRALCSPGGTV